MKRTSYKLIAVILAGAVLIALLNINVTTKQGVDYRVQTTKLPLYLKLLDFFDRHYNYKQLIKKMVKGANTDEERVLRIFQWTYRNIRRQPDGFPIIDDHVWHIIVRGYGAEDQSSDVFTTLCNYADVEATYSWVSLPEREKGIVLSFVKLGGRWGLFDPYRGVYFKNKNGDIADIEEIKSGQGYLIESLDAKPNIDYAIYFTNLRSLKNIGLNRANTQSPLNRLFFELKTKTKREQKE